MLVLLNYTDKTRSGDASQNINWEKILFVFCIIINWKKILFVFCIIINVYVNIPNEFWKRLWWDQTLEK